MNTKNIDIRFNHPSTFILGGPSQCGKTSFTLNLLRRASHLFTDSRCTQNIVYYYKEWQDSFDMFQAENIVTDWVCGAPSAADFKSRTEEYKNRGGSIVILDDFGQEINRDIVSIYTVLAHHTSSSVVLLTQNIFSKNPLFRELSLNANNIVLFKNPRDSTQISHIARQFAPGNSKYIIEAFREATKKAYTYLLFDLSQKCPEELRIRSNIFVENSPISIWIPNNK